MKRPSTRNIFLWVFAAFNLLDSGYLVASAMINNAIELPFVQGYSPA
jgi:hypothetical protein